MIEKQMAEGVIALVKRGIADAMKSVAEQFQALALRLEGIEVAIAQIPAGRDGRDGQKGETGERGRDGVDGRNGIDGLGIDEVTVEQVGERGFVFRFVNGTKVREFPFEIPCVIDRGFWAEGKEVGCGDGVTFGGSYWIAQAATKSKPEIGNPDWRLAVKKGRDGKDFSK